MTPFHPAATLGEHYDQGLVLSRNQRLPKGYPVPQPTSFWPQENIILYERYRDWLLEGGTSEGASKTIYLPVAGHVLGLNLKPHHELDLEADFQRTLDYVIAKHSSQDWIKASRNGLNKFRRFLRLERGLGEEIRIKPFDSTRVTGGLPLWLVNELQHYQRVMQRNWRPARLEANIQRFWSIYACMWRFLVEKHRVQQLADVKRQQLLDYVDQHLEAGYAVSSVNTDLRYFHTFLLFLQEEGYAVPHALLRVPSLKQPDSLPKYLTDEQVKSLRDEIERNVREATLPSRRRLALLDRAAFYLLWQTGMRLKEVEDLRLEDLDFPQKRLSVRDSKGRKDRTVYLTETAMHVLQAYLEMRGEGSSDNVFLYRHALLSRSLIRSRLKTIGKRVGVKVHPHRLRHTCATQLLNAGCRVTSIQRFLGHKELNTTMIYARAHDQTVADDYFAAMQRVEQRLEIVPEPKGETKDEIVNVLPTAQLLVWVEQLALPQLCQEERLEIAESLKQALSSNLASEYSSPVAYAWQG